MALFDTWKWFQGSKMGEGWKTPDYNPGYYEKKQRELESNIGQVNVGPGKSVNLDYNKKTGNIGEPHLGEGYGVNNMAQNINKGRKSDGMNLSQANANQQNLDWLGKLTGVNMDQAKKRWENKGGFEGLMANPAFTMGLAFMQAGAEGKTLGAGSLDNVMKAAGISSHYKRVIENRKQAPITVTAADVADTKDLLKTLKVEKPNWWEKAVGFVFKGDTGQAGFDQAAEQIASAVQVKIEAMQRSHKGKKPFVVDKALKKRVIREVLESGKIQEKKSWSPWTSGTIKSNDPNPFGGNKARGGPVTEGKSYVVGEEGPEIVIPNETAKVLSHDDSKIYAMLLAANPQLQKVSRARSEKILRNRFPEYFE